MNMAVKSTEDEELDMSDMARTLREMQEEKWQRLEWVDEEVNYPIYAHIHPSHPHLPPQSNHNHNSKPPNPQTPTQST